LQTFHFLSYFEGIMVSGEEKLIKPDPKFYNLLLERYDVDASKSLFIDDNARNIEGAKDVGINTIHFQGAETLLNELKRYGVLV